MTEYYKIQLRRDTLANWENSNPVLIEAELACVKDLGKIKIGDGVTPFMSLPYATMTVAELEEALLNKQDKLIAGDNVTIIDNTINVKIDNFATIEYVNSELLKYALKTNVPTKVSQLTNDSEFQNKNQVEDTITSKGYQTEEQVNQIINGKNYTTIGEVEAKGYQTAQEVETAITNKGYTTISEVNKQGFAKTNEIPTNVSQLQNDANYAKKSDIATINNQVITNGGNITIESGGASVTVDAEMNLDSENPVQNKVITKRINDVEGKIPTDVVNTEQLNAVKTIAEGKTTLAEVAQQGYAMNSDIPTNNNQLDNGAGYQTDAQVKATIKTNPEGFVRSSALATVATTGNYEDLANKPNIPEGVVVDLTLNEKSNNAVANSAVTTKLKEVEATIPTDTVTSAQLNAVKTTAESKTTMAEVEAKGYQTSAEVESAITSKGYTTLSEVQAEGYAKSSEIPTDNATLSNGAGYQTASEVDTAITSKGYQTDADVKATIKSNPEGFAKTSEVPSNIEQWNFTMDDGSIITRDVYIR